MNDSMNVFIPDIIFIIFQNVNHPRSYQTFCCLSREWRSIGMLFQNNKKDEFAVFIKKITKYAMEKYYVLPNGWKHGRREKWLFVNLLDEYRGPLTWVLSSESYYENNKLNGEFKKWGYDDCDAGSQPQSHLRVLCRYKNGKLHGEYKHYYENKQLYKRCFYRCGYVRGEYQTWWRNGEIMRHCYAICFRMKKRANRRKTRRMCLKKFV